MGYAKGYFEIISKTGRKMKLQDALQIARKRKADLVYDDAGLYSVESWYWCVNVLRNMKQKGLIKRYKILKQPITPLPKPDKNVVY